MSSLLPFVGWRCPCDALEQGSRHARSPRAARASSGSNAPAAGVRLTHGYGGARGDHGRCRCFAAPRAAPRTALRLQSKDAVMLSNLNIRAKLLLSTGLLVVAFVVFGAYSYGTLQEVEINGPLYARIAQGNDVIA